MPFSIVLAAYINVAMFATERCKLSLYHKEMSTGRVDPRVRLTRGSAWSGQDFPKRKHFGSRRIKYKLGSSAMEAAKENEILHKSSLGDEDDARTSNTRIAQRKRTIPNSTMKYNRNIIECSNNTHHEAPRTDNTSACASELSVYKVRRVGWGGWKVVEIYFCLLENLPAYTYSDPYFSCVSCLQDVTF